MTRASEPDQPSDAALAERVNLVIRNKFGGNAAAAARSLGLGARLIQRVVRDGQPPPARLLTALASLDGVDPAWLLTGKSGIGPTVPLLDRLLPAPLTASPLRRWVTTVPAHPDVALATVYAYRVPSGNTVLRARDLLVQESDLLYIASDAPLRLGVGNPADPQRLVVWGWLAGPHEPVPVALLGDVRNKDEKCVARVFGRKTETYPYDLSAASDPPGLPPAPGPGDVLNRDHVAGVIVGLTRTDLGLFGWLKWS